MARKYYAMTNHKQKRLGQWYKKTGEFRPPEAGEFYLSGAIPEVYYTKNNLSTAYHIMRSVGDPPETIKIGRFVYRLVRYHG